MLPQNCRISLILPKAETTQTLVKHGICKVLQRRSTQSWIVFICVGVKELSWATLKEIWSSTRAFMFSFMYHLLLKRAVSWGLFWRWWMSFISPEHLNVMQKIKWYRWALVYFAGHVLVNGCGHPCGCNCVCNVPLPVGVCFEFSYWLYSFRSCVHCGVCDQFYSHSTILSKLALWK